MGFGGWSRFKRWVKNRVLSAVWPIVRSRLFTKLRSLVSQALVPVSVCGAGVGIVAGAAWVFSFPLAYGALVGAAAAVGAFGIVRLQQRLFPLQQTSRFVSIFRSQSETRSGRLVISETTIRGKWGVTRR